MSINSARLLQEAFGNISALADQAFRDVFRFSRIWSAGASPACFAVLGDLQRLSTTLHSSHQLELAVCGADTRMVTLLFENDASVILRRLGKLEKHLRRCRKAMRWTRDKTLEFLERLNKTKALKTPLPELDPIFSWSTPASFSTKVLLEDFSSDEVEDLESSIGGNSEGGATESETSDTETSDIETSDTETSDTEQGLFPRASRSLKRPRYPPPSAEGGAYKRPHYTVSRDCTDDVGNSQAKWMALKPRNSRFRP